LIYVQSYAHFWFLQATALIVAVLLVARHLEGGRGRIVAAVLGVLAAVWWTCLPLPGVDWFSVRGAIRLAPFFMAGYLVAGLPPSLLDRTGGRSARWLGVAILALATLVGLVLALGLLAPGEVARRSLALCLGFSACLALLLIRPSLPSLAWLGRQSYAIYLFHVFFTAATREMLERLAPGLDVPAVWALSMAAGLTGPVLVQALALETGLTGWLLLGLRRDRVRDRAGRPLAVLRPQAS
jgi:peptidoglycan/LPS O-acetylase OafA/YrhL